jgi:hypothetical protein
MLLTTVGALTSACIGAEDSRAPAARSDTQALTAKVEAIDYASRIVAVQGTLGRTIALKVDDRVKALGKIKAGDEVTLAFMPARALALTPRESAGGAAVSAVAGATAARGALQPAIAQPPPLRIVARVEAIDAAGERVLLAGSNARYVEVIVPDAALLTGLQVGDEVNAVYADALVVEAAPKKR